MRPLRLATTILALSITACDEPFAARDELVMTVLEAKTSCFGDGTSECLEVIESPGTTPRIFYGEIEGFVFEPGVRQHIRVFRYTWKEPPADGSLYRYVLIGVLARVHIPLGVPLTR